MKINKNTTKNKIIIPLFFSFLLNLLIFFSPLLYGPLFKHSYLYVPYLPPLPPSLRSLAGTLVEVLMALFQASVALKGKLRKRVTSFVSTCQQ